MDLAALTAKVQEALAGGTGFDKKVKFDFGSVGKLLIDGAAGKASNEDGAADATVSVGFDDFLKLAQGAARPDHGLHAGQAESRRRHGRCDEASVAVLETEVALWATALRRIQPAARTLSSCPAIRRPPAPRSSGMQARAASAFACSTLRRRQPRPRAGHRLPGPHRIDREVFRGAARPAGARLCHRVLRLARTGPLRSSAEESHPRPRHNFSTYVDALAQGIAAIADRAPKEHHSSRIRWAAPSRSRPCAPAGSKRN